MQPVRSSCDPAGTHIESSAYVHRCCSVLCSNEDMATHQQRHLHKKESAVPLSAALSPSAPRKGTCSAPMSRRKLRQSEVGRTFSVVGSSSPYTANAHTAKSSHPVVGVSSPRGAKGRLWRERLASTKALLGVGTNDACQEVGPCMLASRPTAFRALMKCICLRW